MLVQVSGRCSLQRGSPRSTPGELEPKKLRQRHRHDDGGWTNNEMAHDSRLDFSQAASGSAREESCLATRDDGSTSTRCFPTYTGLAKIVTAVRSSTTGRRACHKTPTAATAAVDHKGLHRPVLDHHRLAVGREVQTTRPELNLQDGVGVERAAWDLLLHEIRHRDLAFLARWHSSSWYPIMLVMPSIPQALHPLLRALSDQLNVVVNYIPEETRLAYRDPAAGTVKDAWPPVVQRDVLFVDVARCKPAAGAQQAAHVRPCRELLVGALKTPPRRPALVEEGFDIRQQSNVFEDHRLP